MTVSKLSLLYYLTGAKGNISSPRRYSYLLISLNDKTDIFAAFY